MIFQFFCQHSGYLWWKVTHWWFLNSLNWKFLLFPICFSYHWLCSFHVSFRTALLLYPLCLVIFLHLPLLFRPCPLLQMYFWSHHNLALVPIKLLVLKPLSFPCMCLSPPYNIVPLASYMKRDMIWTIVQQPTLSFSFSLSSLHLSLTSLPHPTLSTTTSSFLTSLSSPHKLLSSRSSCPSPTPRQGAGDTKKDSKKRKASVNFSNKKISWTLKNLI